MEIKTITKANLQERQSHYINGEDLATAGKGETSYQEATDIREDKITKQDNRISNKPCDDCIPSNGLKKESRAVLYSDELNNEEESGYSTSETTSLSQ